MTQNEKAVANLKEIGITARITNGTVYVCIGDTELELAEFEVEYQAREYDAPDKKEETK